jgi:hypothetical protein
LPDPVWTQSGGGAARWRAARAQGPAPHAQGVAGEDDIEGPGHLLATPHALEQRLRDAQSEMVAQRIHLLVEGPGSGGKHSFPGRDLEVTLAQDMRFFARIIVVEDRMYQLGFPSKEKNPKTFNQFLSTFSLR